MAMTKTVATIMLKGIRQGEDLTPPVNPYLLGAKWIKHIHTLTISYAIFGTHHVIVTIIEAHTLLRLSVFKIPWQRPPYGGPPSTRA